MINYIHLVKSKYMYFFPYVLFFGSLLFLAVGLVCVVVTLSHKIYLNLNGSRATLYCG